MSDGISYSYRKIKSDRKIRVYIASPYTNGWQSTNVRLQMEASNILMNAGFAPYTPLLTHFQSMVFPRSEHEWLELDLQYLQICDAVIRIHPRYIDGPNTGEFIPSTGADKEEALAKEKDIPIWHFNTLKELEEVGIQILKKHFNS